MSRPVDPQLNAGRKRRLLAQLDKQLGRKSTPAVATPAQKERAARSRAGHVDARRSYDELKRAVLQLGGIRGNRDYARSEIPADLYRPRGLAPDEMAQIIGASGFHYRGDVDLFADITRRRDRVKDTAAGAGRRRNPSIVCMDVERDSSGRFKRYR